jgi:sortase A
MRAALRFVASVMIVSGTLLIADAAVTLLWQEPVSAYVAERNQGKLKDSFFDPPRRVVRRRPLKGDAIARIEIPAIGVSEYVVEGTDLESLRKGPGHYPETPLPGGPGTAAIAGHRTTYLAPFNKINEIENGDEIRLEMPYAGFTYEVTKHEVVGPSDVEILDPVGYEQLVLTACHPLYSASQRWVVFAKLVRIDSFAISGEGRWPAP